MRRAGLLLIGVYLAACAADPRTDTAESTSSALLSPNTIPVPCRTDTSGVRRIVWDGTTVQLMVADAVVACTQSSDGVTNLPFNTDLYLGNVVGFMKASLPNTGISYLSDWYTMRKDPQQSCDPVTGVLANPIDLRGGVEPSGIIEQIPWDNNVGTSSANLAANTDVHSAGVNLCIAQRLRAYSPGASGSAALLLSDAEQRELLEVVRERAQTAMLQYALLGEVFAAPPVPSQTQIPSQERFSVLNNWSATVPSVMASMGRDFATAVQLHGYVARELADLFVRSRSSRAGHAIVPPATRGDETWGPGSWQQRLLALTYGGDPLAIPPGGPWKAPTPVPNTVGLHADWPDTRIAPYGTVEVTEPPVWDLLQLARRFDALSFVTAPSFFGSCTSIDTAQSAAALYSAVEGQLRVADCVRARQGDPCPTVAPSVPFTFDPASELWNKYRITPSHAATLVAHLAESIGPVVGGCWVAGVQVPGALDVSAPNGGGLTVQGNRLHLSKDAALASRALEELAPTYAAFSPFRIPDPGDINPRGDVGGFGLGGYQSSGVDTPAERMRTHGSIPAAIETREMVLSTLAQLQSSTGATARLNDYFAEALHISSVLTGTAGTTSVTVRPVLGWTAGEPALPQTIPSPSGGNQFVVTVNHAADDPWWMPATCPSCRSDFKAYALYHPYAPNIARFPDTAFLGTSISTLVADAVQNGRAALGSSKTRPDGSVLFTAAGISLPASSATGDTYRFTFVVERTDNTAAAVQTRSYRLLAGNLPVSADWSYGVSLATDGALGTFVAHQTEVDPQHPAESKYDAFGLPSHWVPPLNAQLLGGNASDSSATYYLGLARQAADEAGVATQTALDHLLNEEKDQAAIVAAAARSTADVKLDRDGLCGTGNAACSTKLVNRSPDPSWYPSVSSPSCDPTDMPCQLDLFIGKQVGSLMATKVDISQVVLDHMADPGVPAFNEYAGGTLQSALIEQWRALQAPSDKILALLSAASAAKAQIDTANAVLNALDKDIADVCGPKGMIEGLISGLSFGFPNGVSFSPGAEMANIQKCDSLNNQLPVDMQRVVEAERNAFAAVVSAAQGFTDARAAIAQSAARIHELLGAAALADARSLLEIDIAKAGAATSFGVYRRYRDADVWRAKALLENARRFAIAARRAIEARYVVDLSKLVRDEAFVASPGTWADDIYQYDLSLPSAVGLSVGGSTPGAIYTNKVKDYVSNLEAFVSGFAVTRPAAVATDDIDLLNLAGLSPGAVIVTTTTPPLTAYTQIGQWTLHCADAGWIAPPANGQADTACGGKAPDRARLGFTMDPWARLYGGIASPPAKYRYNGRWGRVALNFVGTGVKDCTKAADPQGCYAQGFIPYDLTHVGPATVSDGDGIWRSLELPLGRIEQAKGIASEIWLDPLKDGWSTSYISAVARTEFELRPLGGAYELEFPVGPEVVLSHIERVQLLVGSSAWVKQN